MDIAFLEQTDGSTTCGKTRYPARNSKASPQSEYVDTVSTVPGRILFFRTLLIPGTGVKHPNPRDKTPRHAYHPALVPSS